MKRRDFLDPKSAFLNPDLQSRLLAYSRVFAVVVLTLGIVPLFGWLIDSPALTRLFPSLPQMKPIVTIQLVCMGLALLFSTYPRKRAIYITKDILSFVCILFSSLTLYEFTFHVSTGLRSELISLFGSAVTPDTLLIPPTISLLFILSGFATLFIDKGKKKDFFQLLVLAGFVILLPSVIEHFYGIDFIYGFASRTKIALHVTVALILLNAGILLSRPNTGFMSVFSSDSAGGYLARRLFITSLVLPLLIGGIVFLGNRIGWYDEEFRFLLFVSSIILVFTVVVWRNVKAIHILDIDRRKSEQSVYRLAAIVESSDDAIIGRDLKGNITDWNRGAEELYGYSSEEMIGKPISLLFPKEPGKELAKFNKSMKLGKPIKEYEAERLTKDGSFVPVSVTASPIRNSAGRVVGVSTISRDITERKQIERQRELFIGIASHELKTPVTSAKAYAQLLKRHFQKKNDADSTAYIDKMETQLNKLTQLIGYLLDVSTIQKGQLQLTMASVDLQEVIVETIEEIQRTTTHKIILDGQIKRKILGDKGRLTQAIRNILTNAIKYSPEANRVVVSCHTDTTFVTVAVTDFGIGIPKNEQRKIFEPLYRSRGAKKEQFSGLGLGLYLTKEIIRKHGGHISLQSKVGKGTTVVFTLPLRQSKKHS